MKNFSCPTCKRKQALKHLFLMGKLSTWNCDNCNRLLKPKNLSNKSNYIGMAVIVIPGYILLHIVKMPFRPAMLFLTLLGILFYLASLVYFYKTTYLEEV